MKGVIALVGAAGSMQTTGYSLSAPAEPEPRNIVSEAPPTVSTSHVASNTATQTAAIEASAAAANLTDAEEGEGAWGWADRSQIRELPEPSQGI